MARSKQKPFVMTPHGMLYPQALARSKWKKKLLWNTVFRNDLAHAACVHATCDAEKEYLRQLRIKTPIAVIENPVNIPEYIGKIETKRIGRRIGYLGRLHPRKGVHKMIQAWALTGGNVKNAELCIVGSGDAEYENFLHTEVERLNLKNVTFTGFLRDEAKFRMLATMSALCNPSNFENFGMVVPEALIVKVPVIAGTGSPWKILDTIRAGWWIDPEPKHLSVVFNQVLSMKDSELDQMGENGLHLIKTKYTPRIIADKMTNLYRWILSKGDRPAFIDSGL